MSMMTIAAMRAAAAYAPPFRSRLALWLDLTSPDTSIVSGAVAVLGDRSGNARHFTQATDTKRPAYTASDADFGGRPSMTFDGLDDGLINDAIPALPQQTIYIVHKGGTTGRLFTQDGSSRSIQINQQTSTSIRAAYFATASTHKDRTVVASATRVLALAYDTSTPAAAVPGFYLDGVDQAGVYQSALASAGPVTGTRFSVLGAAFGAASLFFNSKMAGVLIYSGQHTGAEIQTVSAWLAARNGL